MFNINLEEIKNHRKLIVAGMILLLVILGLILYTTQKDIERTLPPVIFDNEKDKETPDSRVFLNDVNPPEGKHTSVDTFERIAFKFSQPLQLENIEIIPSPYIKLKKEIFSGDPTILQISPEHEPWENGLEYKLEIKIKGTGTPTRYTIINYIYQRETPKNVTGGDGGAVWEFLD